MNQHMTDGCKGKWIDVSTLAHPRRLECTECRVVRSTPLNEEEIEAIRADDSIPEDRPFPPTWVLVALTVTNGILAIAVLATLIRSY